MVWKEELVLLVAARGGLRPSGRRCTGGKEQRRRLGLLLIQRAREATTAVVGRKSRELVGEDLDREEMEAGWLGWIPREKGE